MTPAEAASVELMVTSDENAYDDFDQLLCWFFLSFVVVLDLLVVVEVERKKEESVKSNCMSW